MFCVWPTRTRSNQSVSFLTSMSGGETYVCAAGDVNAEGSLVARKRTFYLLSKMHIERAFLWFLDRLTEMSKASRSETRSKHHVADASERRRGPSKLLRGPSRLLKNHAAIAHSTKETTRNNTKKMLLFSAEGLDGHNLLGVLLQQYTCIDSRKSETRCFSP